MQTTIEFNYKLDIPEYHFKMFLACNSADNWTYKHSFYKIKNLILSAYGHENNYDLQTITKTCYTCDGTGKYVCHWKPVETCWSCGGSGKYSTKRVLLQRYILNNALFHKPIGELVLGDTLRTVISWDEHGTTAEYKPFAGKIINQIQGIITHTPTNVDETYAYFFLLFHYDYKNFYHTLSGEIQKHCRKKKNMLKNLLRKYDPLQALKQFRVYKNQVHIETNDDLPF